MERHQRGWSKTLYAKAGQVASVALIIYRQTGHSQGFAFVEMTTQAEAEQAISMLDGSNLAGRELNVDVAKTREDRDKRSSQRGRNRR